MMQSFLPNEILYYILSFLRIKELEKIRNVSRFFFIYANEIKKRRLKEKADTLLKKIGCKINEETRKRTLTHLHLAKKSRKWIRIRELLEREFKEKKICFLRKRIHDKDALNGYFRNVYVRIEDDGALHHLTDYFNNKLKKILVNSFKEYCNNTNILKSIYETKDTLEYKEYKLERVCEMTEKDNKVIFNFRNGFLRFMKKAIELLPDNKETLEDAHKEIWGLFQLKVG